MVFFEPKSWWKYVFTDYWQVGLNLSTKGNTVFCWAKKLMERWCLLINEKLLFLTFRWWEMQSFFSQKVDGKVIFTWSFWAFHDIPVLRKYGISCSAQPDLNAQQYRWVTIKHSWYGLSKKKLEPCMKQTQFWSILSWVFTARKVQRRMKEQ